MSEATGDIRVLTAEADSASHDSLRALPELLDDTVWVPASAAVQAALAAHREAVEASGIGGPFPEDAGRASTAAAQYIEAVAEKVQAPFLKALADVAPIDAVRGAFRGAAAEAVGACRPLPTNAVVPRRPEDLAAGAFDGVGRRGGRLLARTLAAVGLGGETRTVDVRGVTTRHRVLRLESGQLRLEKDVLMLWGRWLGGVEAAWSAWVAPLLIAWGEGVLAEGDAPTGLWEILSGAAKALDDALSALLTHAPHESVRETLDTELTRWQALLASDLTVAGTFLLPAGVPRSKSAPGADANDWKCWQTEVLARLEMHRTLLGLVLSAGRARADLAGRLRGEALDPWQADVAACADRLRSLAADVRKLRDPGPADFEAVRAEAQSALETLTGQSPPREALDSVARRCAGLTVGAIQAELRGVPDSVTLHKLHTPGRPLRRRPGTTYTVAIQEMARQAFDSLRMERIRTAPAEISGAADIMSHDLMEVTQIVAFGFEAGASELAGESADASARARVLAAEALDRAAVALEALPQPLAGAIEVVEGKLTAEVMGGITGLAARVLADRVQGQVLAMRTGLAEFLDSLRLWGGPGVEGQVMRIRVVLARVHQWAMRILQRSRSLVGTEPEGSAGATRTALALAAADELAASLPLVYQHLFTSDPASDPALLAGRTVELAEAEQRWERWKQGKGVPLVVTGRRGSGVSSFLSVFIGQVSGKGVECLHRTLDDRLETEVKLARYLSGLMEFPESSSLDELASRILEAPAESVPDIVALEGLEHVYLRVPGGTDLLERLFTLMAETESRIFWIASLTASAWQVVKKAEPAAAVQLDHLELAPLSASDIRAAVMTRHRRSGLTLDFEEPVEGRRLLRRRVRRRRGTDRHQEILMEDYFDRLAKSAQGNLRLAFFQWLRSLDFAGTDGVLVVRPVRTLDWSFLGVLDLTQSFTLKAFLEHHTLNLEEHDNIFRVTRQESYHIFESLMNRQILEVVKAANEEGPTVSRALDDVRYRMRPLLTGAVVAHLATRNIVH